MTRLLLIGAAGLDWAGLDAGTHAGPRPGQAAGALPELSALRARGVAGFLTGAPLSDGPAAWASLATGVQPEAHGVWRRREAWPSGLRATGKASWRVAPLWAQLAAAGVTTGSVAWPASRPGADWAGVHLDDRFPASTGRKPEDWALPRRCMPDSLRDALRARRVHVSQITGEMIAPLVPDLPRIEALDGDGPTIIALGLAQAASIQSAAAWMLGEAGPDAVFIHHPWLAQMRLAFEGGREADFAEAVPAAWRFLDGLLGRLAALAGPETLVLVVSPGWRSAPGVVLATGAGVTSDGEFRGAGLLDVAPTVLALFGMEDGGLPGRRLAPVAATGPLAPAPSPPMQGPAEPDPLMAEALRRHGYQPPPLADRAWTAEGLADLALMMLERDPAGAGEAARAALSHDPTNILALQVCARAHVALGEADPLPALGDALLELAPDRGWGPLAHGACHVMRGEQALASPWLLRAEADPEVATLLTVATVWLAASRHGAAERVFRAIMAKDPLNVPAEIGLAMAHMGRRDFMAAELGLQRALKRDPGRPATYLQLAQTYARTARKTEAARCADIAVRLGATPAMAAAARAGRLKG